MTYEVTYFKLFTFIIIYGHDYFHYFIISPDQILINKNYNHTQSGKSNFLYVNSFLSFAVSLFSFPRNNLLFFAHQKKKPRKFTTVSFKNARKENAAIKPNNPWSFLRSIGTDKSALDCVLRQQRARFRIYPKHVPPGQYVGCDIVAAWSTS